MEAATVAPVRQERPVARARWFGGDVGISLLLFLAGVVLYAPGIGWGVPHATSAERVVPWGSDEIAPLGTLGELHAVFVDPTPSYNPQYPLMHYAVQSMFMAPYLGWLKLTGGMGTPDVTYPFGLAQPVAAIAMLTILARLASLLMGAGIVVATYLAAKETWDRRTGIIAATLTLLLFPLVYYSRTSNVDVPALFWTATGFALIAAIFRRGLDTRRALLLGVVAALATATKDASAFAFIAAAVVLVPWHVRDALRRGSSRAVWLPLVVGLGSAALVYVVASGLVFDRERFRQHLDWISGSTAAFTYPDTFAGTLALLREIAGHVAASMGLPAVLLGAGGVVWAFARRMPGRWLVLPAVLVIIATILPVHFVNFRYALIPAWCLTFFAALALGALWQAPRTRTLAIAAFTLAAGWSLARALDLTYQMRNDSRYAVGEWLAANARPGERIGYFGSVQKLPPLAAGVAIVPEWELCSREDWTTERPEFVLVIPQQHFEIEKEWTLRSEAYDALHDGSLGYRRVMRVQTDGLSSRRPVPFVNPPVQVFVRADREAGLMPVEGVAESDGALLAGIEARLGLAPRAPRGLVRNLVERTREACLGVPW